MKIIILAICMLLSISSFSQNKKGSKAKGSVQHFSKRGKTSHSLTKTKIIDHSFDPTKEPE
jgi:hypothetical protein